MEKKINKIINILYYFLVFIVIVTTIIIIVNGKSLDFFWFLSKECHTNNNSLACGYLFYYTFGYLSIALSFVINKEGVPPIIDHILFSMGALVAGCLWWGICFLLKKGLQKGSILTLNLVKKWRRDERRETNYEWRMTRDEWRMTTIVFFVKGLLFVFV